MYYYGDESELIDKNNRKLKIMPRFEVLTNNYNKVTQSYQFSFANERNMTLNEVALPFLAQIQNVKYNDFGLVTLKDNKKLSYHKDESKVNQTILSHDSESCTYNTFHYNVETYNFTQTPKEVVQTIYDPSSKDEALKVITQRHQIDYFPTVQKGLGDINLPYVKSASTYIKGISSQEQLISQESIAHIGDGWLLMGLLLDQEQYVINGNFTPQKQVKKVNTYIFKTLNNRKVIKVSHKTHDLLATNSLDAPNEMEGETQFVDFYTGEILQTTDEATGVITSNSYNGLGQLISSARKTTTGKLLSVKTSNYDYQPEKIK